jgi:hypothetical protein
MRPAYLRVKVWRRLQALGAVPIKNTVYGLPAGPEAREDLSWLLREIQRGGGDGCLWEGQMLEGLTDGELKALFDEARNADYAAILADARALLKQRARPAGGRRQSLAGALARLRRRLEQVEAIDFFGASGRERAEAALDEIETRLAAAKEAAPAATPPAGAKPPRGAVWVTRRDVHVDRIASAWLIRRFIDPEARFRFVEAANRDRRRGEIRFDMFDGEYTHEGDACTFEVLLRRFALAEPGLAQIAEVVHDLDIKDGKYGRPESEGIGQVLSGIVLAQADDKARLERGMALFDDLLAQFRRSGLGRRRSRPRGRGR